MTEPATGQTRPPVLETERLVLRPLQPGDAALIAFYLRDARVARMTRSIPYPYPPGSAEGFVERVRAGRGDGAVWAMDHRGSTAGELVGVISLRDDGEIGYWVAAPFWSTGFATEAVDAVVAHARASGVPRLHATVFQDNPASAKVLTKAGFRYTGEAETYSAARDAKVAIWHYEQVF